MIEIKVPCTSANIGPGFDTLGIALDLYNIFKFEEIASGLIIEGCLDEFKNEDNLVYTSMLKCFEKTNYSPKGIKIIMDCSIPLGSGLGSSSTCILAGILAGNEFSTNKLSESEVIDLATSLEGHGDNLCPALFGGLTCSLYKDKVYYKKFPLDLPIVFYALTPNFTLLTKHSRNILPDMISFNDSISNIGSTAMVLTSLITGDLYTFKEVCIDYLHEPYRTPLIDDYKLIKNEALKNNAITVYLSGAGPTIMVIAHKNNPLIFNNLNKFIIDLKNQWTLRTLNICNIGTTINTN